MLTLFVGALHAAGEVRPPATPLITHDPYFSVWSTSDQLTDSNTTHWTGKPQPLGGLVRVDGSPYRFMGKDPEAAPAMRQVSRVVRPTETVYSFEAGGVRLELTFFTPAFPQDLDLLSRPVTYLIWKASASDGKQHDVAIYFDASALMAVNTPDQEAQWGRHHAGELDVLSVGSREQAMLARTGDDLRIEWGHFFIAVPRSEPAVLGEGRDSRDRFTKGEGPEQADDVEMPRDARSAPRLSVTFDLGKVGTDAAARHLMVAYDEGYSVEYLHRRMRPYWKRHNLQTTELLQEAEKELPALLARGQAYDDELTAALTKTGGQDYADIAVLAYRQTLAAHKLVADVDGRPLLFSKENFSNGDMDTVDVTYPSAPFFLFFNPRLLEAQIRPVFDYAELPRWPWPFAPHDLGRYPLANGQEYGGGERTEEDQMPVEESGNLLILATALTRVEGNTNFAAHYWPLLTKWAEYLRAKGLDPENQLCTDDFAGHLAHNANLSVKAIEALAGYAQMARGLGKTAIAKDYEQTARGMAAQWMKLADDGDHYRLAFDKPGSWSQKYNLVWDGILGLSAFPSAVAAKEYAFYKQHLNTYGLPLDEREDYTKLDWELWTATLATNEGDFNAIASLVHKFLNDTPSRVPMTDWYSTTTAKQIGFQARSVVGGVYIKALANAELAKQWRSKAQREGR